MMIDLVSQSGKSLGRVEVPDPIVDAANAVNTFLLLQRQHCGERAIVSLCGLTLDERSMPTNKLPLRDFYDMLERHDWFYQMSDAPDKFNKGQDAERDLRIAKSYSPDHKKLYDAYFNHKWEGGAKPERPA